MSSSRHVGIGPVRTPDIHQVLFKPAMTLLLYNWYCYTLMCLPAALCARVILYIYIYEYICIHVYNIHMLNHVDIYWCVAKLVLQFSLVKDLMRNFPKLCIQILSTRASILNLNLTFHSLWKRPLISWVHTVKFVPRRPRLAIANKVIAAARYGRP